jgi:F-type H+-transporting ATPase subunit a
LEEGRIVFQLGPIVVSDVVVTSWCLTLLLGLVSWLASRRLRPDPGPMQTALEGIVSAIEVAIQEVLPQHTLLVMPFVATLWLFLVAANLVGLIPGLHSPTRDLSATAALAVLVFLMTHWFGIRSQGLTPYLRHYLAPNPVLLPFHLVSEITRTVALAVRLFGNIMSLEIAALLVLMVGGLLVPIPLLMLHVVEALVQAYIFGMLALIYIAGGIQSQRPPQKD